jgi:hypothetical protein
VARRRGVTQYCKDIQGAQTKGAREVLVTTNSYFLVTLI